MSVNVALVTSSEFRELDADTRLLIAPLEARGVSVTPAVWDDPGVHWAGFDLAVIRSCWDYVPRRGEFVAWASRVKRLANPAEVIAWNTDKRYLADLADGGVPVVPTTWVHPEEDWEPAEGEWVIKPAVSISSRDTGRYRMADPEHRRLAGEHVRRLQGEGRVVMVQPYLRRIEDDGETSLVYLGGEFSHAIRKGAMLEGPDRECGCRTRRLRGWSGGVPLPRSCPWPLGPSPRCHPAGRRRCSTPGSTWCRAPTGTRGSSSWS